MHAIYSILYSTGQERITSTKRTHGVQAALLLRELNRQLLKYLLDIQRSEFISLPIFKPQMGSMEALSLFLQLHYILSHHYIIITRLPSLL